MGVDGRRGWELMKEWNGSSWKDGMRVDGRMELGLMEGWNGS